MEETIRIKEITLEGFKCFFKKQSINCDADVIILTGNNGFGKTSFIEALELMATGKIEPRLGENSTNRPFENYINKNLLPGEAKARIEVKCQDGRVFQATLLPEILDEESTLFPLNGFSTSFVRSSCFFYQDGVESTFGRSQEGIQGIADAFVGDFPNKEILLDALVKAAAEVENIRSSFRTNLGNEDTLKNEAAEQARNLQAIIESNEYLKQLIPFPAKLVIASGKLSTRYKENIQKWVAALTGHEQGDQPVCKLLEEAIRAIESIRKQALADIPSQADINKGVARLKELLDNLPDFFPVTETSPKEDIALKELTEKEKALELELARIKTQMGLLLSEEQLPIPGTNISTWMGEIPLIASIDYMLKVKASSPEVVVDEIWSMLEKHGGDWSDKLKSKWLQYKQLRDEATAITQKIFEIRKEITGIKKKEADFDNLLQALKLWSVIFGAPLEKVNLEDSTGYDLKKARMMLKEKFVNINAAETMTAWNKVLEYLHKWQQIEQKLETIKLNWTPAAREADKKLSDFISWATKRNLDKWIEAIKGNALRENYISQLNQALEYILFQFGMGKELAKNVHFKRSNGKLYIQRWSEDNIIRETNIFPTFSTAQINQLAIAYMLALNCGVKNHPLGFICLDDVSSAFDLNNLAADAHLIRMLAYGNNQRRQVFITSHHDIITSRLLPLLLPPSGFRLKVIEFTSFRPETGPELRFYECKQARSGYIALQNVFKVEA
ncbi:AAA family ATPase [Neomoorella thermoacetica]|uniref:AAA family ATPase n=1 Tax=Neomoorella thermoacetica TaxID=1525 RepID=UPI0008FAC5B9|nr:ATP-binding protein [Moorella thermoacetica]OIQ10389.1 DNA replication and repair protein RecF [Moorella thermoacetica]OIQ53293.1 DNA replication and repair protein RecF [Moorella thermoacetica]